MISYYTSRYDAERIALERRLLREIQDDKNPASRKFRKALQLALLQSGQTR